jgi:mannan endo-1,4-beta-mannosidase
MVRVTIPRLLALAVVAALLGYAFVYGPRLSASAHSAGSTAHDSSLSPKVSPQVHSVFPPVGKKFIGIMSGEGPYNFSTVDTFTKDVGYQPEVYEFSQGWALNQWNAGLINAVANRGMLPLISWEPWNYLKEPKQDTLRGYQPAYTLANIIKGDYDSYIRSWAEGVKRLGYTIALRLAHEMNGYWYPWAIFANGNQVGQYVQMWRHVYHIFQEVGATNVIWVWSPNIIWNSFTDLAALYPGNNYVTWVGLSGYYGTPGMGDYQTFNQIFNTTIDDIRSFTDKPIVITETGATDVSGLMAPWITSMFQQLAGRPGIIGLIWYEDFNVVDWRVVDDPKAVAAFHQGFSNPIYQMTWKPGMVPLETVPLGGQDSSTPAASSPP